MQGLGLPAVGLGEKLLWKWLCLCVMCFMMALVSCRVGGIRCRTVRLRHIAV